MGVAALDLRRRASARLTEAGTRRALLWEGRARIVDLVRFTAALLVVGNLGRLPVSEFGVKTVPLLLNDLLVASLVCVGAIAIVRSRSIRLDGVVGTALVFACIGLVSAIAAVSRFGLTGVEFLVSTAFLGRWLIYFGVYLVVINFARRSDVEPIWGTLEKAILVFAGFGVFQSIFLPGFAQIVFPDQGWDVQGRRLVSTFLDPNFAGGFIVIAILVLLARLSYGVRVPHWKLLLLFAALILTISRSAFLALVAGGAVLALVRGHSWRLIRFGSLLVLLVVPFVPVILAFAEAFGRFSMSASTVSRIILWQRAVTVYLDNPVLGIGFNTYPFVQHHYGWEARIAADSATDGGLLFIGVLTGTVGVLVYVAMLGLVIWKCRAVWRDETRPAAERGLTLGIAAATVAIVIHSVFLNSLLYHFIVQTLWILWALAAIVVRERTQERARGKRPDPGERPRRRVVVATGAAHA